jgi:hypothetical protein
MIDTEDLEAQKQALAGTEYGINEALLRSEIGFWREMIDSCGETQPAASIERMHQAMALAQSRLDMLFQTYRETGRAGAKRCSNVYHLDERRKPARSS